MTSEQREALRQQLRLHEGWKPFPYTDTVGKLTIGCGRNLTDRGLSDDEIAYLLTNDINLCTVQLQAAYPWFESLDPIRQRVLIDLCFNLGITKLRVFKQFLAAMSIGAWATAKAALLNSKYATQVGQRAQTLTAMIETGEAQV